MKPIEKKMKTFRPKTFHERAILETVSCFQNNLTMAIEIVENGGILDQDITKTDLDQDISEFIRLLSKDQFKDHAEAIYSIALAIDSSDPLMVMALFKSLCSKLKFKAGFPMEGNNTVYQIFE